MIVQRRIWAVKPRCLEEAEALTMALLERFPHPHARRVYVPKIAPHDTLALEIEFQNLEELEAYWAALPASPGFPEFLEKWFDLRDRGGTNEIWTLVE